MTSGTGCAESERVDRTRSLLVVNLQLALAQDFSGRAARWRESHEAYDAITAGFEATSMSKLGYSCYRYRLANKKCESAVTIPSESLSLLRGLHASHWSSQEAESELCFFLFSAQLQSQRIESNESGGVVLIVN
jgi:hypothetical protein